MGKHRGGKRKTPSPPTAGDTTERNRPERVEHTTGQVANSLEDRQAIEQGVGKGLDEAELKPSLRRQYATAVTAVLDRLSPTALHRLHTNLKGLRFYASHQALTESFRRRYPRAKITLIKGAFDLDGILHLDGGGVLFGRGAVLAEFYAHEISHAIDGVAHSVSGTKEWAKAWRAEIARTMVFGKNGASSPREGFAEFGQLLLGTPGLSREQVREVLPRCLVAWEASGL